MKKFLAFFAALLLVSAAAFADNYTGGTQTANATFDVTVIQPLSWITPPNVTLPDIVKGVSRDIDDVTITFTLKGEPQKFVTITTYGPIAPPTQTGVTLDGEWKNVSGAQLGTGTTEGTYDVTYKVKQIISDAGAARGVYTFTIKVDAIYGSI